MLSNRLKPFRQSAVLGGRNVVSGIASWLGGARCLLVIGALATVQMSAEQAVTWIESYDEALAEARSTGKPIFLEFRCAP